MDDGLKQRLIGAIVLLALAVIFVPVVFDQEQIQQVDRTSQIPEAPDILPVVIAQPQVNESVASAPPIENLFVPDEEQHGVRVQANEQPEQPRLTTEGVPEAWTLQVASYRNAERAEEMRELLVKDGYTAYTQRVQSGQGEMTRLFVGPKLDKARLLQEQKAIEERYKVATLVLQFNP